MSARLDTTGVDMKGRVYPYGVSVNNFVVYEPCMSYLQTATRLLNFLLVRPNPCRCNTRRHRRRWGSAQSTRPFDTAKPVIETSREAVKTAQLFH